MREVKQLQLIHLLDCKQMKGCEKDEWDLTPYTFLTVKERRERKDSGFLLLPRLTIFPSVRVRYSKTILIRERGKLQFHCLDGLLLISLFHKVSCMRRRNWKPEPLLRSFTVSKFRLQEEKIHSLFFPFFVDWWNSSTTISQLLSLLSFTPDLLTFFLCNTESILLADLYWNSSFFSPFLLELFEWLSGS